jgi:hypothetical protein
MKAWLVMEYLYIKGLLEPSTYAMEGEPQGFGDNSAMLYGDLN